MSRLDKAAKIGIRLIVDAYVPDLTFLEKLNQDLVLEKSGGVVIHQPIQLIRDLDDKGYWQKAFDPLGLDAKAIAQKISDDPTGESLKAVLKENWENIMAEYEKTPFDLRQHTVLQYKTSDSTDGHRGVFTGQVSVPHAAKLFENEAILRHMLNSFPQEALVVEPGWMKRIHKEAGDDMATFVKANESDIRAATKKYFAEGGSLAKCGALLGSVNMVMVLGVIFQEVNGRKVYSMVVATLREHALDGINLWEAMLDPHHPDVVIFSNKLLGKHKVPIMDWANNFLGQRLMATTWKTVPLSVEAEVVGVPLDEYIADLRAAKEVDPGVKDIFLNRWVFAGLDRTAFLPAGYRKWAGSNLDLSTVVIDATKDGPKIEKLLSFTADTPVSEFHALGLKLEKSLPEGFYINRSGPVDPFAFMTFSSFITVPENHHHAPTLESAAFAAARNPAQQLLDTSTVAKIRSAITEQINAPLLKSLLALEPAGTARTMRKLRQDLAWASLVDNYLLAEVTPDLEAQVRDVLRLDAQWADVPDLLLEKAVLSAARETICLPLLAPQGYVDKITALTVYETMKKTTTTTTPGTDETTLLKDKVKMLEQAAEAMDSVVKSRRQELLQLGEAARESEEYKEKEKEIVEKEQKVKELTERKVDVEQMVEEMKMGEGFIKDVGVEVKEMEEDPKRKILEHGK